jgi:hypothetical protein
MLFDDDEQVQVLDLTPSFLSPQIRQRMLIYDKTTNEALEKQKCVTNSTIGKSCLDAYEVAGCCASHTKLLFKAK